MERIGMFMVNDIKVILYHKSDEVYMVPQTGYFSNPAPTYISEIAYYNEQIVDADNYSEVLPKRDIVSIIEDYL